MPYRYSPDEPAWSKSGAVVAVLATAAAAFAWAVALRPVRFATPVLALAGLFAVGGVWVITRARMPTMVKAILLAVVCASLLTCFATQDVLGLRRLETRTGDVPAEVDRASFQRPPARADVTVTADGAAADAVADGLADSAAARLADTDIGIAARVVPVDDGAYRLSWSLLRGDERQWCGMITETPGPAKPPFANFGARLADAAGRSRGGPLDCAL